MGSQPGASASADLPLESTTGAYFYTGSELYDV